MAEESSARVAAEHRLKAQAAFKRNFFTFIGVAAVITAIWALSGQGYFWPAWVYVGLAFGLVAQAWGAYGPREKQISQADVDAEAKKFEDS